MVVGLPGIILEGRASLTEGGVFFSDFCFGMFTPKSWET